MAKSSAKKKVLIISHDKIGSAMAGPGIRYHYIAETLADKFDVIVGLYEKKNLPDAKFKRNYKTVLVRTDRFIDSLKDVDIVITHWLSEDMIAYCNQNGILLVIDLYVVGPVENLAAALFNDEKSTPQTDGQFDYSLHMYRRFFENADLFLVSNRRQLDYWLGYAFGADKVHMSTYTKRPLYDRMLLAPMGIDAATPLKHTKNVMKAVVPGIEKTDKLLLWTGGIWGHFDGIVLIKAMKLLAKSDPNIKLFFSGTKHPNPNVIEAPESIATYQLARELGLLNKTVFFNDGWVPYHERINYLMEADAAVNTHKASIETEFSHRTRVLDHILAGLPSISTEGDYLSDSVIKSEEFGLTVPPGDEKALRTAILELLQPDTYERIKLNVERHRRDYDWSQTLKPLKDFLLSDPAKLPPEPSNLKVSSPAVRLAKRVLPKPVKKAIVRSLKTIR